MPNSVFEKFIYEFRDLYGSFSVDEIIVNQRLVQLVEEIEAIITSQSASYLQ